MCTGVQVARITAPPVVAFVAHDDIRPNRTVEQDERSAMCSSCLWQIQKRVIPVAITRLTAASLPFPAFRWMVNRYLATVILQRASGLYDVSHQLRSLELVTGRAWQGVAPHKC